MGFEEGSPEQQANDTRAEDRRVAEIAGDEPGSGSVPAAHGALAADRLEQVEERTAGLLSDDAL